MRPAARDHGAEGTRPPAQPAKRTTSERGRERAAPLVIRSPHEALDRARRLSLDLGAQLREPVRIAITDNRRTMLSAKRRAGKLEVRLHHMFLDADAETVMAIGRYLQRADRRASRRIDAFIESNRDAIDRGQRRRTRVRTEGDHHDLRALLDEIVGRHFGGATDATITWGRRTSPRRGRSRRSIQLGTYSSEEQLIRIHPVLDQVWVPRFYVESVVFHEMLHHELGAEERDGRRCFHTPEFRRRERSFECFERAQVWERANLDRLLRA